LFAKELTSQERGEKEKGNVLYISIGCHIKIHITRQYELSHSADPPYFYSIVTIVLWVTMFK